MREAHKTSVRVAEGVTQWAEPAGNGSWELDCVTFSRLMAFGALGTSLFGNDYMTWPVAREFEKVMMDVTEELPTWMPCSVPPLWNAKFNEFRTKCQRLRELGRELVVNGKQSRSSLGSKNMGADESVRAGLVEDFMGSLFSSMGLELGSFIETRTSGIMSHGSLNTAGVLCSVFVQLAHHPHIQAKVCLLFLVQ